MAMTVPLLLVTLLGLVDVGRAFVYTTAVSGAAREAAYYASTTLSANSTTVATRACNETGFAEYNQSCGSDFSASYASPCLPTCGQVSVTVEYRFKLVSGYLFQSMLGTDTFVARSTATFRTMY